MLEPRGLPRSSARGDGEEGVALVRRTQPALVLLDLLMPGVDGFAVVERLRADPDDGRHPDRRAHREDA